jgi:hypothetical protein
MEFVCAVLRCSAGVTVPLANVTPKIKDAREAGYIRGKAVADIDIRDAKRALERFTTRVAAFEEKSGLSIDVWEAGDIGEAVRFVREAGIPKAVDRARTLLAAAEKTAETLRKALAKLDQ